MAYIFDLVLMVLKWPTAFLTLAALPSMIKVLHYFNFGNMRFWAFICGVAAYFAFKFLASARSNVSLRILEHEFTHIFFALLTFHKIIHVHLNMDESGGAMGFKGRGNWLIAVGPYFFPLFLFIIMLVLTFFSNKIPDSLIVNGMLGYFFANHVESVAAEIHPEQTDFKVVGFPFCWLFLPGANLFFCSIVLAFNSGGWINVERYISAIYKMSVYDISVLAAFFTS